MHYHLEIVMPPVEDVPTAVASILEPFDENEENNMCAFFDWYVIGGRFAGEKTLAALDQGKIAEFRQWCIDEGVTVSGFTAGKEEIAPASQIPKVDAKWNEMFPSEKPVPCPLFKHSNNQYGKGLEGLLEGDICELKNVKNVNCARIIFAGPSYIHEEKTWCGPLEAVFMLCRGAWNGVNFEKTDWDGTLDKALEKRNDALVHSREEYAEIMRHQDNWLVVTVDYHT